MHVNKYKNDFEFKHILDFVKLTNIENKKFGVYLIYCEAADKVYIGSTVQSFKKRINRHIKSLTNNLNDCPKLQNYFNKYGCESFYVKILEDCSDRSTVIDTENKYLELHLKAKSNPDFFIENGLNVCPVAGSSIGAKLSDAARNNMRIAQTGMKHSQERIENNRLANIGKVVSVETRDKISKSNIGRKMSQYTLEQVIKANTGRISNKRKKVYQYEGDRLVAVFECLNSVKKSGFNISNVSQACRGIRKKYYGFTWSFKERECNDIAA